MNWELIMMCKKIDVCELIEIYRNYYFISNKTVKIFE